MATNSDHLEELKKRLYRRGEFAPPPKRGRFTQGRESVPTSWGNEELPESSEIVSLSLVKKIFLIALGFFIIVVGLSAYFLLGDSNVVSPENIDIAVRAPVSVKGGEILPLEVIITTNNPVPLEFSELVINFPLGTKAAEDITKDQTRFRKSLGTIKSGETVKELVRAVMFGKENTEQDIVISLEYRTEGSNAIFSKDKKYTVLLTSAPVNMVVSFPEEVNAGQDITIDVEITSSSEEVLRELLFEMNYPAGFSFRGATPAPTFGSSIWRIGDMAPGSTRRFKIIGTIDGQEEETKAFRFTTGVSSANDPRTISTPYSSTFQTLTIRRPFVGLVVTLNGDSAETISAEAGKVVRGDITWLNNLPGQITDGELSVIFRSQLFNETSVSAQSGFYRSSDKTIVWNKQNDSRLAVIEPGASGHFTFSFSPLSAQALSNLGVANPAIDLEVVFRGQALSPEGGTSAVENREARKIRLNSQVGLTSRALYSSGPFTNTGPMPPRVNQETTYTIVWTINNTTNDLKNVVVRATLPSYVRWVGTVFPTGENVTFDQSRGEIVWDIGNLARASTGSSREVAFQVAFTASLSQLNNTPTIISDAKLTATDAFTNSILSQIAREVTIAITTDPNYNKTWAVVTQ